MSLILFVDRSHDREPLSAPHNWCDRRCHRCPLAAECPIPAMDDLDVEESLERAIELLEAACVEAGCDPSAAACAPPSPESPSSVRFKGRARDYSLSLTSALDVLEAAGLVPFAAASAVVALRVDAFLIATKSARVAVYLGPDGRLGDDDPLSDGALNVFLLDHLLKSIDSALAAVNLSVQTPVFRLAREDIRREVDALLSTLAPHTFDRLTALMRSRRAPSPFATLVPEPASAAAS